MDLLLLRNRFYPTHTIGQLYINGDYFCFVLEDVVREVPNQPVEKWKVQNETAIPQGRYDIALDYSPHFGANTLTLRNVAGFTYIHMHAGNTDKDTDGCLILGYKLAPNNAIAFGTTRPAVADLKGKVQQALDSGEKVSITIKTVR
jgi:hypothetical protein